jgi:hypothetical protein
MISRKEGYGLRRLGEERKGNSPMLHFRVRGETMERLKKLARERRVSVSEFVRDCLEKVIGKEKKQ